jgi:hypothetical protein
MPGFKNIHKILGDRRFELTDIIIHAIDARSGLLDFPVDGQLSERATEIICDSYFRSAVLVRRHWSKPSSLRKAVLNELPRLLRSEIADLECISAEELRILDDAISRMNAPGSRIFVLNPFEVDQELGWQKEDGAPDVAQQIAHKLCFLGQSVIAARFATAHDDVKVEQTKVAGNRVVPVNIQSLRRDKGWSYEDLANLVEIDKRLVIRHLKGECAPRGSTLNKYADKLKLPLAALSFGPK